MSQSKLYRDRSVSSLTTKIGIMIETTVEDMSQKAGEGNCERDMRLFKQKSQDNGQNTTITQHRARDGRHSHRRRLRPQPW